MTKYELNKILEQWNSCPMFHLLKLDALTVQHRWPGQGRVLWADMITRADRLFMLSLGMFFFTSKPWISIESKGAN